MLNYYSGTQQQTETSLCPVFHLIGCVKILLEYNCLFFFSYRNINADFIYFFQVLKVFNILLLAYEIK